MTEISRKKCKDCSTVKPLDEFHNNAATKDGKKSICKPCSNARSKAWYEKNRARILLWEV